MGARVGAWAGVLCLLTAGLAGAVVIETVPVGDVNNVADSTGYGRVGYAYNIGKYEVTAGQYCEFLNAVAGVDANGLYNTRMWWGFGCCKIERFAGDGTIATPYQYRVASDYANRPVNSVNFWNACRLANWLHNGQPSGLQDNSTTEDGAYTLTPQGIGMNTVSRNGNWQWAVTSEDEWYKAAYYKGGTRDAGYWLYPTGSNAAPGQDLSDVSGNNANYDTSPHVYPIDNGHYTTVVGEFQSSASPYGTFDQGGNVWEWNETIVSTWYRRQRGGSFGWYDNGFLQSSTSICYDPTEDTSSSIGFRVVQVPEPATLMTVALAIAGILRRKKP